MGVPLGVVNKKNRDDQGEKRGCRSSVQGPTYTKHGTRRGPNRILTYTHLSTSRDSAHRSRRRSRRTRTEEGGYRGCYLFRIIKMKT